MNEDVRISRHDAALLNRRALRLMWKANPAVFVSTGLASAVKALTPYVAIYFSARLIGELAGRRNEQTLTRLVLILLLTTALLALLGAALTRWKNAVREAGDFREQKIFADKILSMDFTVVDTPHIQDLRSQIRQNENWAGRGLPMIPDQFEQLVTAVFQIGGAAALSASLFTQRVPAGAATAWLNSPLAALGMLALLVGTTLLSPVFELKTEACWADYAKLATFGNRIFGFYGFMAFRNIEETAPDIRMYRQDILCRRKMKSENVFSTTSPIAKASWGSAGIYGALAGAISKLFLGVIYLFVCLKAWGGAFGVGLVTQYVSAVTALSAGLTTLIAVTGKMRVNAAFLQIVFEFLDTPNEMYQGSLTVEKRSDRKYEVEFRNVTFRYPASSEDALKNVSLKFNIGERLAIVGQNGSGKTTMIKLLCRLYDPTEGEILLNGINIRKYSYPEYLSIFSVVFQDFQLLSFSLSENVAVNAAPDRARVAECLEQAGFGDRLAALPHGLDTGLFRDFDQQGVEVSGGEAQKIAIARALYKDAPFIVLDEPTAALDPVSEAEIYARFNTLISDKTAIYISHRLSSCRFCDRIAVFDKGRIVQFGSHEDLVADEGGKYHELWTAQAQYYT